jgi:hypothetical protein
MTQPAQPKFSDFFTKLHDDAAFRARFVADPAATLRQAGFDPTKLNIPANIDANTLNAKLDALFSAKQAFRMPTSAEVSRLSADQLWSDFGIIKGATGEDGDPPIVVAVVAYGTAVAVGTQAVVVGRPVPLNERTFTVRAANGAVVEGLNLDEVATLFQKMNQST